MARGPLALCCHNPLGPRNPGTVRSQMISQTARALGPREILCWSGRLMLVTGLCDLKRENTERAAGGLDIYIYFPLEMSRRSRLILLSFR